MITAISLLKECLQLIKDNGIHDVFLDVFYSNLSKVWIIKVIPLTSSVRYDIIIYPDFINYHVHRYHFEYKSSEISQFATTGSTTHDKEFDELLTSVEDAKSCDLYDLRACIQ